MGGRVIAGRWRHCPNDTTTVTSVRHRRATIINQTTLPHLQLHQPHITHSRQRMATSSTSHSIMSGLYPVPDVLSSNLHSQADYASITRPPPTVPQRGDVPPLLVHVHSSLNLSVGDPLCGGRRASSGSPPRFRSIQLPGQLTRGRIRGRRSCCRSARRASLAIMFPLRLTPG